MDFIGIKSHVFVAPVRERGLKSTGVDNLEVRAEVAPVRERGLKLFGK